MKHIALILIAALTCVLTGCPQSQRLAWSPDGKAAVIVGPKGLQILHPDGTLGPVIAPEAESFAWLPDNRSLMVTRKITLSTWAEARSLLPALEIDQVERLARAIPHLYRAAVELSDHGKVKLDEQLLKTYGFDSEVILADADKLWIAALMRIDREQLRVFARESKLEVKDEDFPKEVEVNELALIRLDDQWQRVGEPAVIERSLRTLGAFSVQAKGARAAYLRGRTVILRDLVTQATAELPDAHIERCAWSPDGGTLYTVAVAGVGGSAGVRVITGRSVTFSGSEWKVENAETLSELVLSSQPVPMQVMPDGRILFASLELRPAEPDAAASCLFILDPGTKAVTRVNTPGGLPSVGDGFSVSASGRSVAILQDEPANVTIVDIATGAVEQIASVEGWKNTTPPEWRGEDLYFATAESKDAAHPDLLRKQPGKPAEKVSTTWPDELRDCLMSKNKSEQPAGK